MAEDWHLPTLIAVRAHACAAVLKAMEGKTWREREMLAEINREISRITRAKLGDPKDTIEALRALAKEPAE